MICLECDTRMEKGIMKCPECGTEYGDLKTLSPVAILPTPVVKQESPKRGRPRKEATSDVPTATSESRPKSKPVINVSSTITGVAHADRIIPWNRCDPRFPSVIAPARCNDGQGGWLPFCPANPKKIENRYSTNPDDVLEWVESVMLGGHERHYNYTLTAILYFADKYWSKDRIDLETVSDFDTVRDLLVATFMNG